MTARGGVHPLFISARSIDSSAPKKRTRYGELTLGERMGCGILFDRLKAIGRQRGRRNMRIETFYSAENLSLRIRGVFLY